MEQDRTPRDKPTHIRSPYLSFFFSCFFLYVSASLCDSACIAFLLPFVLGFCLSVFFFLFLNFFLFFLSFFIFNQSSILYTSVYTCQSQSPNSAHHHPLCTAVFPPCCPYICSLHLCLNFCPANRFICTISLGSTYMR